MQVRRRVFLTGNKDRRRLLPWAWSALSFLSGGPLSSTVTLGQPGLCSAGAGASAAQSCPVFWKTPRFQYTWFSRPGRLFDPWSSTPQYSLQPGGLFDLVAKEYQRPHPNLTPILNLEVSKLWLRGHLRTFGNVEIRSPLFSQVLKRPRFEVGRRRRVWTV